ncbi:MAG TPA: toll/interleukin-1 receptor domain-containing protein [Terriglobales bacterium]|jgi:hypothetical protein|nr:toll/interleukin-1 receptor domain-containing protein [Terriglobales bacterium]
MASSRHLAELRKGALAWNAYRRLHPKTYPHLESADLSGADLKGSNLSEAKLFQADLRGANLSGADLRVAELREACLSKAVLSRAQLVRANLIQANLTGADLRWANLARADLSGARLGEANPFGTAFSGPTTVWAVDTGQTTFGASLGGARLDGADFGRATVGWTAFGDCDLSRAKGLETVLHAGPSTIGIDTVYKSKGKIPLEFLRGAGVPDNFIEYMGSLTGKSLEFYSCFISYSTKDQEFADRVHADLQNKGVRCWFAPHDVQAGKKLHEQIDEAIRRYERLLLILSPNSMNSEWVKTEIRKARKRERAEKKRVLFPVRLVSFEAIRDWELFDADEGKDLAVEIREYFIPDFTDWRNHDPYTKGFEKLLRDLKTEDPKAT